MKRIMRLSVVCLLAVVVALFLIYNPATVALVINNTLIKLPLWLLVVGIIIALIVIWGILKLVMLILYGPKVLWLARGKKRTERSIERAKSFMVSALLQDNLQSEKKHYQKYCQDSQRGFVFTGLYWQYLYEHNKITELQSILLSVKKTQQEHFLWRYYQALVYCYSDNYELAKPMLKGLLQEKPHNLMLIEHYTQVLVKLECLNEAMIFVLSHKKMLSLAQASGLILLILAQVSTKEQLEAFWGMMPKSWQNCNEVELKYLSLAGQFYPLTKASEMIQKRLSKSCEYDLVALYFTVYDRKAGYEFVRSLWRLQKEDKSQGLLYMLLLKSYQYQDWPFLSTHLHLIEESRLNALQKAQYLSLKSTVCDYQSKVTEANQLSKQVQTALLRLK